jgi:hypothetical protein
MSNKSRIGIGSLNARSLFKVSSNTTLKQEFHAYLRSFSLGLDVLCIQELSQFHAQTDLTMEQAEYSNLLSFLDVL